MTRHALCSTVRANCDRLHRLLAVSLVAVVLICLVLAPAPGKAQAPAWSRGFQLLPVRVSEASRRAEQALQLEGYSLTNHSGASEDAFFAGGQKGNHAAVIMVDRAPGTAGTWVNIVVSTAGTSDNGLPGLERQRLQARMNGSSPASPPTTKPSGPAASIDWTLSPASHRGQNGQRFTYIIPANGDRGHRIYGTDVYTDDTSIGTAAVHAGLISFERGGTVTIEIRPGQTSYTASTRNGVTSNQWGAWSGSFVFVR